MNDIAQRFGITTAALIAANPNVDPSVMRIGSELTIP
jgi:LysM repeat protein